MKTLDIRDLRIGDYITTNGKPTGTKEGEYYRITAIDSVGSMDIGLLHELQHGMGYVEF